MKKTLLAVLLSSPMLLVAQQKVKILEVANADQFSYPVKSVKAVDPAGPVVYTKGSDTYTKNKKTKNYSYVELGTTYYDLQTNSSPGRRIVLHADGTVSTVWTTSPDAGTNYPNRGSGYNYSDGSNFLASSSNKIETKSGNSENRTGWPSIMLLDNGKEFILAHESSTGGFVSSTNSAKGNATFTSTGAILDDESVLNVDRVPIWNRSAHSNGKVHVISNYWASETSNIDVVTRNGVNSPTTYSRWDVASGTADVEHMLLPGYDSTLYQNGGGDNYAIDTRDSIVAILIGGFARPVSLWKSTDNGQTWTYTDVDELDYKGDQGAKDALIALDTFLTNDGSVDVMIDNDGKVHAFWGEARGIGSINDDGDTTYSGFVTSISLVHWKEGDVTVNRLGGTIDMDGDNVYDVNSETFAFLDTEGNVPTDLLSAARIGSTNLVTMPSASVDKNGNLFVVYSAPVELALHYLNANFRDIHVMYSKDGGDVWSDPQNITQERTEECNFPCAAKMANDYLHIMWQQDAIPGTALQNNSVDDSHPNDINRMHYAAIPVTDILNDVIGQNTLGAEELEKKAEVFVVSQNRPNPFSGTSEVTIYLRKSTNVDLIITDILGNVVNAGNLGTMNAGNHEVSLDANGLSSGVYFYTLSTDDHSVTRKMQVQ